MYKPSHRAKTYIVIIKSNDNEVKSPKILGRKGVIDYINNFYHGAKIATPYTVQLKLQNASNSYNKIMKNNIEIEKC